MKNHASFIALFFLLLTSAHAQQSAGSEGSSPPSPRITFNPPRTVHVGDAITLTAYIEGQSTTGFRYSIISQLPAGTAQLEGNRLTFRRTGRVRVRATHVSQLQSPAYVERDIEILPAEGRVVFEPPTMARVGEVIALHAYLSGRASSFSYSIIDRLSGGNAELSENQLILTAPGRVRVSAVFVDTDRGWRYEAHADINVQTTTPSNPQPPTTPTDDQIPVPRIGFTIPTQALIGEVITLSATSTSGLTNFRYELHADSRDKATLASNRLTLTAAGLVQIRAIQAGDENYEGEVGRWQTIRVLARSSVTIPSQAAFNTQLQSVQNSLEGLTGILEAAGGSFRDQTAVDNALRVYLQRQGQTVEQATSYITAYRSALSGNSTTTLSTFQSTFVESVKATFQASTSYANFKNRLYTTYRVATSDETLPIEDTQFAGTFCRTYGGITGYVFAKLSQNRPVFGTSVPTIVPTPAPAPTVHSKRVTAPNGDPLEVRYTIPYGNTITVVTPCGQTVVDLTHEEEDGFIDYVVPSPEDDCPHGIHVYNVNGMIRITSGSFWGVFLNDPTPDPNGEQHSTAPCSPNCPIGPPPPPCYPNCGGASPPGSGYGIGVPPSPCERHCNEYYMVDTDQCAGTALIETAILVVSGSGVLVASFGTLAPAVAWGSLVGSIGIAGQYKLCMNGANSRADICSRGCNGG